MSLILFVYLYATVSFIFGGYLYYRGVLARPLPKEMDLEHRAVLSLVTLAIGVAWLIFLPALLALGVVHVVRWADAHAWRFRLKTPREARVRS